MNHLQLFQSTKRLLLVILFLALALRLLALLFLDIHPVSDSGEYIHLAESLISGHGYAYNGLPTAYYLPGYPTFLVVFFSIIPNILFVQIVQIMLDVCSCFLLFRIGSLLFSERSGLFAALIWAVLPTAIVLTTFILTETLFTTLFLASITQLFYKKNKILSLTSGRLFTVGILWGLCSLIKPNLILAPVSIILFFILKEHRIVTKIFVRTGIIIAGMTIVVSPWIIRNYLSIGEVTLSTNGGVNFWIGNNPSATGTYNYPPNNPIESITGEVNQNKLGYKLGWEFIRTNPVRSLVLVGKKTAYMFVLESPLAIALLNGGATSVQGVSYRELYRQTPWWLLVCINLPYCILIIAGIFGFSRTFSSSALILLLIGLWIFTHAVFFGGARFHFPILPLFALGATSIDISVLSKKRHLLLPGILSTFLLILWTAEIYTVFFKSAP